METEIAIIGGGLTGVAMALAAAEGGVDAVLIDADAGAQDDGDFDGRAYALSLASVRMLRRLGLWEGLAEGAQPIEEIKASDGRPGTGAAPLFLHFNSAEIEDGPMGHMVEDRHLRPALRDALAGRATHLRDTRVVDHDGGTAVLDDGRRVAARLIVAADGRGSATARRAGIRRTGWDYGQTALVAAIAHARPHHGIAHQYFMPSGPLAILPLAGQRSSIVWSERTPRARAILALSDDAFLDVLRPRFGDFLGEIALAGARHSYPLSLSIANRLIGDRLALIGDAAHGVHPIAGQGLNAGLKDVAALAEVLTDARRRGEDMAGADVLARYQTWRRFDVASLAVATDGFNRLFSNDNPVIRAARDLGMGLVQSMPGLRRSFIREAAGVTGDVPRLLRGLPL